MNPVILVHGINDTGARLDRLAAFLREQGRETYSLDLAPSNGSEGLDRLAHQVAAFVGSNFASNRRVDLVAFSMGGLVARYYLQRLGGIDRTDRLVTISTPHRGTMPALLSGKTGIRQMRPSSAFLRELNADLSPLERLAFTSIWTPLDLMIVPANSSVLPVGRSHAVRVPAHVLMVYSPKVFALVGEALR